MTPNKTFKWKWYSRSPRERILIAAWLLIVLLLACAVSAAVVVR